MTLDPYARIARTLDGPLRAQRLSLYIALGDSFTAGSGCSPGQGWPDRLTRRMRARSPELELRNLAVHGATSATVLEQLPQALDLEPDLVTVVCGGNDVLRTTRPDPEAYTRNLDAIARRILQSNRGARVVTATAPERWDFLAVGPRTRARIERGIAHINAATRLIASHYGLACLDVAGHAGLRDPANFARDGLHPSPLGHARAADAFFELIEARFGRGGRA